MGQQLQPPTNQSINQMSSFTGWTRLLARYTVAENQYIHMSGCMANQIIQNSLMSIQPISVPLYMHVCQPITVPPSIHVYQPINVTSCFQSQACIAYVQYSVCMLFFASKNKFSKMRFPCNSYYFSTKRGESLYYESKKVSGSRSFRQCLYILRMVYGDWQYISYSSQKF